MTSCKVRMHHSIVAADFAIVMYQVAYHTGHCIALTLSIGIFVQRTFDIGTALESGPTFPQLSKQTQIHSAHVQLRIDSDA